MMEDLPDVPFDKVLAYLDFSDLLKARLVSKKFHLKINNFKVRSLCVSEWDSGQIEDKHRLVVDEFAQNFIRSSQIDTFFMYFGHSLLSGLRHFRVCDLDMFGKQKQFIQTLN